VNEAKPVRCSPPEKTPNQKIVLASGLKRNSEAERGRGGRSRRASRRESGGARETKCGNRSEERKKIVGERVEAETTSFSKVFPALRSVRDQGKGRGQEAGGRVPESETNLEAGKKSATLGPKMSRNLGIGEEEGGEVKVKTNQTKGGGVIKMQGLRAVGEGKVESTAQGNSKPKLGEGETKATVCGRIVRRLSEGIAEKR